MKIVTLVSVRPQFIKAAVVSRAFQEHRPDLREVGAIRLCRPARCK